MATSKRRESGSTKSKPGGSKPKPAYSVHPVESFIKAFLLGIGLFAATLLGAPNMRTITPFYGIVAAQVIGGIVLCFIRDWRWFGVGLLASFPVCIGGFAWFISKIFGLGWF